MHELINRPKYLKQLIQNKDVDLVKINIFVSVSYLFVRATSIPDSASLILTSVLRKLFDVEIHQPIIMIRTKATIPITI